MAVVKDKDGNRLSPGAKLTSFRGEEAQLVSGSRSRGEGKVTVMWTSGRLAGAGGTYYPSVFGLPPITE